MFNAAQPAAVLKMDGWDSHANQAAPAGALANKLRSLDGVLSALRDGLGPAWSRSVVVVATEFGREVAFNGTQGTDHGTDGGAFVLGGAVFKGVLSDHLRVATSVLEQTVFPASTAGPDRP